MRNSNKARLRAQPGLIAAIVATASGVARADRYYVGPVNGSWNNAANASPNRLAWLR